ncbi:monovalent cation/H(+) antiporter subunit G [Noviherbaspirillum massiliense]|uniref:monovalent cation/H(+) antiporter subunit G n=1 Tax=Noviherbaspirillum massiliense TaxID=1465823 RepID=UPI0002F3D0FA|nr:monovalent cation/H(+) antiporter subunit G [Noviherbaspirillum massiliense]
MTTAAIPLWAALPASILLVAGGLLALIGSFGLLRLPDFFARMHGPTMGNTLGIGCVLLASMLVSSAQEQRLVLQQILISLFIVLTSPVTALLLMQAAIYRHRRSAE